MFADFCAEIHVETIREYEQEYLKQQTELDKKQYDQHISSDRQQEANRADDYTVCLQAGV